MSTKPRTKDARSVQASVLSQSCLQCLSLSTFILTSCGGEGGSQRAAHFRVHWGCKVNTKLGQSSHWLMFPLVSMLQFLTTCKLPTPGMRQDDGFKQGICLKLILFLETVQKLFCEPFGLPRPSFFQWWFLCANRRKTTTCGSQWTTFINSSDISNLSLISPLQ